MDRILDVLPCRVVYIFGRASGHDARRVQRACIGLDRLDFLGNLAAQRGDDLRFVLGAEVKRKR